MSLDEGYIKYASDWTPGPAAATVAIEELEAWRHPLYAANLIGQYEELGIGFGNVSIRGSVPGQFIISGTQTGHIEHTDGNHYAVVTDFDIAGNRVSSMGPVEASSESLTHAAIYELDTNINAVVHVHSPEIWKRLLSNAPTTATDVAYGTPEMAREFIRLYNETEFPEVGVAVMAGHEEGIVSIATSLREAATRVLDIARNSDLL